MNLLVLGLDVNASFPNTGVSSNNFQLGNPFYKLVFTKIAFQTEAFLSQCIIKSFKRRYQNRHCIPKVANFLFTL